MTVVVVPLGTIQPDPLLDLTYVDFGGMERSTCSSECKNN